MEDQLQKILDACEHEKALVSGEWEVIKSIVGF